jgi:peroxiredoxin
MIWLVPLLLAAGADPFAVPATDQVVVLLFTRTDCPISNRYAPEVRRLHDEYAKRGVKFWLVYPDKSETLGKMEQHRAEYGYPMEALHDPKHEWVKRAKATITPEAAIFVRERSQWKLVYHGRIDDRYVDYGKARAEPSRRDLAEVLDAVLAGRPAPFAYAKAIGCYLADLK